MMHANQVDVSEDVVRLLVDDQFPHWRRLPLQEVSSEGTDNAIFRIGDDLAARFPLHAQDMVEAWASLESEARALGELAACSPVPAPAPVALGAPGHGYPLPWAVQTWLPGRVATQEDPGRSRAFAEDLAGFITSLRAVDTQGRRFSGGGRGGNLPDHDASVEVCLQRSEGLLDVCRLRRLWDELRNLPPTGPDVMSHKDLIPGNVLVRDGRLVGVLDGGAFGPADPALDLVSGWHLLEREPREELRRAVGCGEVEWCRGMAWAFQQSMGLVWYYAESNPPMSRLGRRTLTRLLDETSRTWPRGQRSRRTACRGFSAGLSQIGLGRCLHAENRRRGGDMTSNIRVPKAEITGVYGAVVKMISRKMFGEVPEALEVMWNNRQVLKFSLSLGQKSAKWHECDQNLKSYAHMAVASLIGCTFCLDLGYFQAHNDGLDVAKAREVPRWRESDVFTPLERDVMEYAEAMSQTPPTVTDELSARLLEQLGAPALVELTAWVALANQYARGNVALGIEAQGFAAACDLAPLAQPSSVASQP